MQRNEHLSRIPLSSFHTIFEHTTRNYEPRLYIPICKNFMSVFRMSKKNECFYQVIGLPCSLHLIDGKTLNLKAALSSYVETYTELLLWLFNYGCFLIKASFSSMIKKIVFKVLYFRRLQLLSWYLFYKEDSI